LDVAAVVSKAHEAKKEGETRFCMGAVWRKVKNNREFDRVIDMVREIKNLDMEVCCTLGMLNPDQAERLKQPVSHERYSFGKSKSGFRSRHCKSNCRLQDPDASFDDSLAMQDEKTRARPSSSCASIREPIPSS